MQSLESTRGGNARGDNAVGRQRRKTSVFLPDALEHFLDAQIFGREMFEETQRVNACERVTSIVM